MIKWDDLNYLRFKLIKVKKCNLTWSNLMNRGYYQVF
jgi:hypothetical protein